MSNKVFRSLAVGALASVILRLVLTPQYPEAARFAFVGVGLTAALAADFFFRRDVETVGLILLVGVSCILYFIPTLHSEFRHFPNQEFASEDIAKASLYALIGVIGMALGYLFACKALHVGPLLGDRGRRSVTPAGLVRLGIFLVALAILALVFDSQLYALKEKIGRIAFLLDQLPVLAAAVSYLAILDGYKNRWFKTFVFGVFVPLEVMLIASHTLYSHLIILFGVLVILSMLRTQRVPIAAVAIAGVLTFPAFELRMQHRIADGWQGELPIQQRLISGAARIVEGVRLKYIDQAMPEVEVGDTADARFNSLGLLAHCVHFHEATGKEFKYGSTFWWLPFSPIPRIFWHSKPKEESAKWFGFEYNLKSIDSDYALVLPVMVESYINGGIVGVILINFGFGLACGAIYKTFRFGAGTVNMIALLSVMTFLVYIDTSIMLTLAGAFQAMLAWYFICLIWVRAAGRVRAAAGPGAEGEVEDSVGASARPGNGNARRRLVRTRRRAAAQSARLHQRRHGEASPTDATPASAPEDAMPGQGNS